MVREGNTIYIEGKIFHRNSKIGNYDNKEIKDIKKEINRLKEKLYLLEMRKGDIEEIKRLEDEISFWKEEMNKFDNIPSRKKLKTKFKKIPHDKLKELVLEIIEDYKKENYFSISKENIAFRLGIKVKDLDKLFMELNREGILSQARHKLIHDSNRDGYCRLLPSERSDWGSDLYTILEKKA